MAGRDLLKARVTAPLLKQVGSTLSGVTYRCLEYESKPSDIHDADFYWGGELLLEFSDGPLFVSWDENAGWTESHFSLQASESSCFRSDWRFDAFDASDVALWRPHIGRTLDAAQVLGWDGVPYAILLSFPLGSVVAGSSVETRMGDGDDLLVRDPRYLDTLPAMESLWSAGRTD